MNKIFLNTEKIFLTQIEFKNHDRSDRKTLLWDHDVNLDTTC